ncbi:MAG: FtsX-like permease family protein, partial [Bacteroidota bacterium]
MAAVEQAVRLRQYNDKIIKRGDIIIQEDKVVTADSGFFSLFTFPLVQGDPMLVLKEPNSVVMTTETARKYFQEEDPIGQQILIDGQPFLIKGIMEPVPENSHIRFSMVYSIQSDPQNEGEWGDVNTYTYFRLNDQANIATVDAQLDPLMKKYYHDYDELKALGYTLEMFTQPMIDIHLYSQLEGELEPNGNSKYLYIFGAIALFILLIACINFMNLATARSSDRAKEVGIRKTMGSLRSRLIGQFLAESLLLSLVSVVLALGLAELLRIPFNHIAGLEYQLPYTEIWFAPAILLLGIIVGVLAGSYPAFYLTHFQPVHVLRGRLAT